MIVEFGHFALVLAVLVAVYQMIVPAVGAWRGDGRLMQSGDAAALTQVMLLVFAPEQSMQLVMRVAQLMQVLRVVDRNI